MESQPNHVLFQTIQFSDDQSLDNFMTNLNKDQSWLVMIEALKFAQRQGSFTLVESELISKSIRTFLKPDIITKDDNAG